jgi:hypothetical protein
MELKKSRKPPYFYQMRCVLILLTLLPAQLFAQASLSNGVAFGANYMGGKIFLHTPKIHVSQPAYSSGLELSYRKQTTGTKDWHQRFGFPEVGLNVFLSNNGSALLGHAIGIYPSIQFRILSLHKAYWYGKFGGGIGYVSKHWERTPAADSMNNIVGSAVNNFTMLQTGIRFLMSDYLTGQVGLHFYHLSNAAARSPNYGINTYGLHAGISVHPQQVVRQFDSRSLTHFKNPMNLCFSSTLAFAEDKTPDGPLYPVFTGTVSAYTMYRNKNRVLLGTDAIYNYHTRALIHNGFQMKGGTYLSPWQYTAFAGHEFLFGNIGFPLIVGAYLNRPVGGKKMYQKLGMNYHFYRHPSMIVKDAFLSLVLKTHLAQAQYAELGFGFFL